MIKEYLKYYGVPALLLLVSAAQLVMVGKGLNRWRGGGFGMYSDFHFSDTVITVNSGNEKDSLLLADSIPRQWLLSVEVFPSKRNIKKLAGALASKINHNDFTIEVWQPSLRMDSLYYKRQLMLRYNHKNGEFEK